MKIIITEEQLNGIINEGVKLSPEEIEKRLKLAKKLAVKYPNPRQFALKHKPLYYFLRGQGLMDTVFPKRKLYKPDGYWTPETIGQEASKYDSKSDFYNNNQVAYNRAVEFGILNDLFPFRSNAKTGPKKKWTLEKSIEVAKEFDGSPTEFYRKYPTAYLELKNNDLLSFYFKKRKDINHDEIINQAKQYKDRVELRKNNLTLYNKLATKGLLYDLFPKVEMSHDEIINKAKEYETPSNLSKKNRKLYYKLSKVPNGFDLAFGGQHKLTHRAKKFIEVAKQYQNRYDLLKNNRYAYKNLESLGLIDKIYNSDQSADELIKDIELQPAMDNKMKKLLNIARKFPNKYELRLHNPYLFNKLKKMDLLDKIFPPKPVEKLSLGGTLQDLLKSKEDTQTTEN